MRSKQHFIFYFFFLFLPFVPPQQIKKKVHNTPCEMPRLLLGTSYYSTGYCCANEQIRFRFGLVCFHLSDKTTRTSIVFRCCVEPDIYTRIVRNTYLLYCVHTYDGCKITRGSCNSGANSRMYYSYHSLRDFMLSV